ncbi:hypothetical protein B0T16DRAFT_422130 [Cercophora newfieldiana]|uniref:NACHT domain-containing protein n=1 Tax=Cercophora newfieldiana TaxID=92897 RepID=A0AA39XRK5_9PEZI|nr:hypothetical protein B0T16DRAFT_422130 [Cercophora newfieldiana]
MESLAALGLASNVVQFVDFTSKLISTAHTLYISATGTTAENTELELLAKHIRALADNACPSTTASPAGSDPLHDLAKQCRDVADEVLLLLDSFVVRGHRRTWKSIHAALRSARHAAQMDAILKRLDRISSQLRSHLIIRGQRDISSKLDVLEMENRRLGAARTHDLEDLRKQIGAMFAQLETARDQDRTALNNTLSLLCPSAEQVLRFTHEQQILEALRFEGMDDRHIAIHPAHQHTFSWIFESAADSGPPLTSSQVGTPVDFVDWLKADDPIFWVSGKPGSGKSTLMKYLCSHHMLKESLKVWAGKHDLVVAKYFFWDLGKDELQKSQVGLLRCILYQIFRRHPNLMQQAFPADHDIDLHSVKSRGNDITLSVELLLSAFRFMGTDLEKSQFKFCFLIDGLDEYHGKPADIIRLIEILKGLPQVKICVSSRPWNEFETAFGSLDTRRIYMENLTRGDIDRYVRDTFERDPSFRDLREDDDGVCEELINEIVKSAKGVFLWVRLVVQSLLEGITNADRMIDLRRRLISLPTDLEEYFKRIVFTVDPFYRQQTAHFFQVTIHAPTTLPLMFYWFMDQEDPVCYATKLEICPLSMQATNRRLKQTRKRLNACCKGLLEVQFYDDAADLAESSLSSSVFFNWKVDFLHRTAKDFLLTDNMQKQMGEWALKGFDPRDYLCAALLAHVKCTPQEEEYFSESGPVQKLRDRIGGAHMLDAWDKKQGWEPFLKKVDEAIQQQRQNCGIMAVEGDRGSRSVGQKPANKSSLAAGFFQRIWRFW